MDVDIIDNDQYEHLDEVLRAGLQQDGVTRVRIAVGYLYMSGLKQIRPELDEFIEDGGRMQILIGNQNKRGLEELVAAYDDILMADTDHRDATTLGPTERNEIVADTKATYGDQTLYQPPTVENQEFFEQLIEWIDEGSIEVRLYMQDRFHAKAYLFERREGDVFCPSDVGIVGSSNLSFSGLRSNTELNGPLYRNVDQLKQWYDDLWDDAKPFSPFLLESLRESWAAQTPAQPGVDSEDGGAEGAANTLTDPHLVYVKTLWELYSESLQTAEDSVQSFTVYEDLYDFQQWAVDRGIRIVNQHDGVLVSDVVGMGKTFVGLGLLEHFHARNRLRGDDGKMVIICPKHLQSMWERMVNRRYNFRAEVISQGMLSKEEFGDELLAHHDDATVCLVDEAHHYRNSDTNRYRNLRDFLPVVNQTILLTATPYTKSPMDVYNQIKLFHIDEITDIQISPPNLRRFIDAVEADEADLSDLLSHIMIRRTRQDIINQYGETDEDGREYLEMGGKEVYLPERHLRTVDYNLREAFNSSATRGSLYGDIIATLEDLNYARYALGTDEYLRENYRDQMPYQNLASGGQSILGLMKSNLLKRLESSISAFYTTLDRMLRSYRAFRNLLDEGIVAAGEEINELVRSGEQLEYILEQFENMESGEESPYDTDAFYLDRLKQDIEVDISLLADLRAEIQPFVEEVRDEYETDDKAEQLRQLTVNLQYGLHDVLEDDDGAEKILVFSQFADTVEHLAAAFEQFQDDDDFPEEINVEAVTSDSSNVDDVIERFAPEANDAEVAEDDEIDVLIGTDVAGEGVNLQDANFVINYDLHWNPLRLIQRIGRVDRLGSEHDHIYAFNFFPERELEDELEIVERIEQRVREIGQVLGEDGAILSEEDQINQSYMEDIYDAEDFSEVEEDMDDILGGDDLIGPAADLQDIQDETPEVLDEAKRRDGLRSAMQWERDRDAVFILCRQGDYTEPYLIEFDAESDTTQITDRKEAVAEAVKARPDTPVADVDRDTYTERFAKAYEIAVDLFADNMRERMQFEKDARGRESQDREYVLEQLQSLFEAVDNDEQRRAIEEYQNYIQTVTADRILDDFAGLRRESTEGEALLNAVREIISRYNLQKKYEERKSWQEKQKEPPHAVAGMYLVGDD